LFHLSERFPQFLKDTEPKIAANNPLQQNLIELPAEIARFERAKAELMLVKGTENDASFQYAPLNNPAEFLMNGFTVFASPCLRLLKQKFPLNEFLNGLQQGHSPEPPVARTSYVALTRTNYRIRVAELEQWQFAFIENCKEPASVHACAQKAAEASGVNVQNILAALMIWLPVMLEMGMVGIQEQTQLAFK
jgi:hypothetical protein